MHLVEPASGTFTKQELGRLAVYRTAVAAGFYTDWDGTAETTDGQLLSWLTGAGAPGASEAFPFTADELERLEHARAAVAAGYYTEDVTDRAENA